MAASSRLAQSQLSNYDQIRTKERIMARFLYRPDHPEADEFGMVTADLAGPLYSVSSAPGVIRDEMPATKHMADGQYYTSKSKFRATTKAHGCVEVGNETSSVLRPRAPVRLDQARRVADIKRTIDQLRSR